MRKNLKKDQENLKGIKLIAATKNTAYPEFRKIFNRCLSYIDEKIGNGITIQIIKFR